MAGERSQVITLEGALAAYDAALVDWERTFGWPVFGRSAAGMEHLTTIRARGMFAPTYWAGWWKPKRNHETVMRDHFWALLLQSLAVGGGYESVEVTFPGSPFTWRGPYSACLRDALRNHLLQHALPQTKARMFGEFKSGDYRNRLRIRIPHK